MVEYSRSLSGRLLTTAAAIALTGGGISALAAGSVGTAFMCLSLLGGVMFSVMAVAYATQEQPIAALLIGTIGPFALFSYVLSLGLVRELVPTGGYALVALGLLALSRAVLLTSLGVERPAAHRGSAHAL